ncbi:hypothetical protein [Streptomyces sp. NPDC056661]|uniref:hypothetical protein n=1 Tax=Streptomyces sp. NPDC056661 TaxID=3345898 RepID=UPI0036B80F0F
MIDTGSAFAAAPSAEAWAAQSPAADYYRLRRNAAARRGRLSSAIKIDKYPVAC